MIDDSRVMIIGASGLLGKELRKLFPNSFCPNNAYWNIVARVNNEVLKECLDKKINIIINCVAINRRNDSDYDKCASINVNIVGAKNVTDLAYDINAKLVYISTDYIRGYVDEIGCSPVNYYAETKLAAEIIVKSLPTYLIIRGSFSEVPWPFDNGYVNVICSKLPVNEFAKRVKYAIEENYCGIQNIAGKSQTVWDYAKSITSEHIKLERRYSKYPMDTSLENTII